MSLCLSTFRLFLLLGSILSGALFGVVFHQYELAVREYKHSTSVSRIHERVRFDPRELNSRARYEQWLQQHHIQRGDISLEELSYGENRSQIDTEAKSLRARIRVHCLVLTRSKDNSHAARNTWTKNCDSVSFYAKFKDATNPDLTTVKVFDDSVFSSRTFCKVFTNLVRKRTSQFDWLLVTVDGTFAILENLRFHVATLNASEPYYLGRTVKHYFLDMYNAYDSGIVLSQGSVRLLAAHTFPNEATCDEMSSSGLEHSASFDAFIGHSLAKHSVYPMRTVDDSNGFSSLFHPFTPSKHIHPHTISSYEPYWSSNVLSTHSGLTACSDRAITFGTFEPDTLYLIEYLLYRVAPFRQAYKGLGNKQPGPEAYIVPSDLDK